jgi:diacylglycerol O-acyltransferase
MSAVPVERLTVEDARILACERGAVVGHTCKVLVVDGEHDVNAFRARVGPRLAAVPRLLDRLVETPLGIAPPAWLPDPEFAIERHVREGGRVRDQGALQRAVAALMESRLDREHPLWSLDILALDDGRTAGALRLHHCMADGTVAMRIVGTLLLDQDWAVPVSASAPNPTVRPGRAPLAGSLGHPPRSPRGAGARLGRDLCRVRAAAPGGDPPRACPGE